MMRFIFLLFVAFLFTSPNSAFAQENSFITIVNPLRLSSYTKDYLESFKTERSVVESKNLPATWLLTYDVMSRDDFVGEIEKLNNEQEVGILLEVTEPFARDAGVKFNKVDNNWHRATSLFLSGYSQEDRTRLIDTVFKSFKEKFGYYPKSIGSWWTDSFSLDYMRKKYAITGNLGVSDQYDLDGYQVWGTWWSVPYYPSRIHTAIPGQTQNKLEVLQFRWAARDPLNGYKIETHRTPSMYSLQDYRFAGLTDKYFKDLLTLYAIKKPYNDFGHATIGLEGDLSPDIYESLLSPHLNIVKNLQDSGQVKTVTMAEFAKWYFKNFPKLSPRNIIETKDLLGTSRRVFWFQNPHYRIGIEHNLESDTTEVIDLREYPSNFEEPNYKEPNKQLNLYINLPFKVDTVIKPDSVINLNLGKFERVGKDYLAFEKGKIEFKDKEIFFPNNTTIRINNKFDIPQEGLVYRDYSYTVPFSIKSKLPFQEEYILIGVLIVGAAIISIFKKKGIIVIATFIFILAVGSIIISPDFKFYISQDEYGALKALKGLPRGNVLVYDKDCLNCSYRSKFKPAAMAGKKGYVGLYSNQPVEIDFGFQIAKTSADAKKILKDKNIKYVYLSKYGDSIENLPYLPQDLGLEKVYINANAEIWKVK